MKVAFILPAVLCALALQAERVPYARYQTIVDRQMFGMPPPGFDPAKPPSEVSRSAGKAGSEEQLSQEQREIKSAIHFSVINVTPGGETAVGFTDNGDAKNPVHYYLKVGETRNGWTVKEADPVKATMTIAKGEVEVSLAIGDHSAKGGGKKGGAPKDAAAAAETVARQPGGLLGSFRGRRMLRHQKRMQDEAQAAKTAEEAKRAAEERARQEAEEKAQRDQERAEHRAQLLQIQEELRKAREAREAEKANKGQYTQGEQ